MILFPVLLAAAVLSTFGFAAGFHPGRRCRITRMVLGLVPPSICVGLAIATLVSPAWVSKLETRGIIDARDPLAAYVFSEIVAVAGAFVLGPAWGWTIARIVTGTRIFHTSSEDRRKAQSFKD
jgi:hypothetical protein